MFFLFVSSDNQTRLPAVELILFCLWVDLIFPLIHDVSRKEMSAGGQVFDIDWFENLHLFQGVDFLLFGREDSFGFRMIGCLFVSLRFVIEKSGSLLLSNVVAVSEDGMPCFFEGLVVAYEVLV